MATHSSVLAWRIPGMGEPGGLLSMGSHRVGHDWSDLAAAAATTYFKMWEGIFEKIISTNLVSPEIQNQLCVCVHVYVSVCVCTEREILRNCSTVGVCKFEIFRVDLEFPQSWYYSLKFEVCFESEFLFQRISVF